MLFSASTALPDVIPDNQTIPQFLLDTQHRLCPRRGDYPCLIEESSGRSITYTELRERTFALANGLQQRFAFGDNDIALICSPNHVDYPTTIWAIHRLGGIFTGASPNSTREEIVYQLKKSEASLIFVHSDSLDLVLAAAKTIQFPDDRIITLDAPTPTGFVSLADLTTEGSSECSMPFVERILSKGEGKSKVAVLCFSSGTTGPPKAVSITHYALIANVIQMTVHNISGASASTGSGYNPGDISLMILPLNHVAGLICNLHFPLFSGMTLVVVQKYSLLSMMESIVRYAVSHLLLVPPQVVALTKASDRDPAVRKYDLRSVRHVLCGAAPLSPEMSSLLLDLFPEAQVGQIYGLTETATTISMLPARQARGPLGSVGQLLPGVRAKVVKDDGSLAAAGEPGELYVSSPSLALGYHNDDAATRDVFINEWVKTGDQVLISPEGELYILDRIKEMIKVKAFQVAPAELEGCLLEHPDVLDCAVVGTPDAYSGEVPFAYVVLTADARQRLKEDASEFGSKVRSSIMAHVAARKSRYKQIRYVEFLDAIPKTPSGKILRRKLRSRLHRCFLLPNAKL
ncbi:hypothetical protein PLEOSDRAFT_1113549 [Pleurotus ostreatus PC15]|uniref:Uncharacterized protein n=1 Tax=Pleurotus ostreatus (strain PC15) TaxID=1137138 RepID=A0A067NFG3_PLEO1|nr:hypothetical protein PLEOSDRAFT_1113549 [Pleurotus ostreatus PC15]